MGVESVGLMKRTRGVYTPFREEFSRSTPKDLRPIWKLCKKSPATVVIFGGSAPTPLSVTPCMVSGVHLGGSLLKGAVLMKYPCLSIQGVRGFKLSGKNWQNFFRSLGSSCPSFPKDSEDLTLPLLVRSSRYVMPQKPNSQLLRYLQPKKCFENLFNSLPPVPSRARVDFICHS